MKETVVKNNKTKSWFLRRKTKSTNPQPDSSRKKENNQINKSRNDKGEVTTGNRNTNNYETIMNNYMAIKWITYKKLTDSQKSSIFQD